MATRFGLSEVDIDKLCSVFNRYPDIEKVIIYGSRAKGNFRRSSDIDLTIFGHLDWQTFNQLELELDELLLPYQIDLSLHELLENTELKAHIERVGKPMYSVLG